MEYMHNITEQCIDLLGHGNINSPHKELIQIHLVEIKNLLQDDYFIKNKCDFFAKARMEELLSHLRDACEEPADVKTIANLVSCTAGILNILKG